MSRWDNLVTKSLQIKTIRYRFCFLLDKSRSLCYDNRCSQQDFACKICHGTGRFPLFSTAGGAVQKVSFWKGPQKGEKKMSSKHRHYSPPISQKADSPPCDDYRQCSLHCCSNCFYNCPADRQSGVPTSGPVQSGPSASEPSASEDKESSSSDASESQEESPESSAPESSGNESVSSETEISIPEDAPAYQKKYPDLYVKDRPKLEVLDDSEKWCTSLLTMAPVI